MSDLESYSSAISAEDVFSRYDSGLIAGFDQAKVTSGVVCAVTPQGIELVAQYEEMELDVRTSWSQVVKLFKGGGGE